VSLQCIIASPKGRIFQGTKHPRLFVRGHCENTRIRTAIQSGQLITFGRNSEGQLGRGHAKAVTLPGTVRGMQVNFLLKSFKNCFGGLIFYKIIKIM
jgi:hypothetical protein